MCVTLPLLSGINGKLVERVVFFQNALMEVSSVLSVDALHVLIARYFFVDGKDTNERYLGRSETELTEIQAQRRPGRPPSTREGQLKEQMKVDHKEYDIGFWIPEARDIPSAELLTRWNGQWGALSALKFIRLSRDGACRSSKFPPSGES